MFNRICSLLTVLVGLATVVGCARNPEGRLLLEDLRRERLVVGAGADVTPRARTEFEWPAEGDYDLATLLAAADRLNPRIAAARARVGAAGGRAWQASLYPNPTFELENENVRPSNGDFGVSETTLRLVQPIIVSDRREAAFAEGASTLDAERWRLEQVRRDVHGRMRRVVTDIAYGQRAIELHEELRVLAERTFEIARARYEGGAAPGIESIRARIESNRLGLAIERLEGDLAAAGARLAMLLGGQTVNPDRIRADALASESAGRLPPLEVLVDEVRRTHPAILSAASIVEAAEHRVDLEDALATPDITARIGVGIDHADDEGFLEAGVGIPFPLNDANEGNVLAARFDVIRARRNVAAVSNDLTGALSDAYFRWASARSRLDVFDAQILSGAQRAFDQTSTGYEAGKYPFLDLLDAQRTLSGAELDRVELRRNVSQTQSEIEEILGGAGSAPTPSS